MASTTPRTPSAIVARYQAVKGDDVFGFKADVLFSSLAFEHAAPFLKPTVTPDEWEAPTLDADVLRQQAVDYLAFAFGKAADHRGLSAGRSVDKLTEYAWLLGSDEVVAAMDDAPYPQYGVPKLAAFAAGFGVAFPDDEALQRMARGESCRASCDAGCGS